MDEAPHTVSPEAAEEQLAKLTEKQLEYMRIKSRPGGASDKVVAQELGISPSAVEKRAASARQNLGIEDGDTDSAVLKFIALNQACGDATGGISHLEVPLSLVQPSLHGEAPEAPVLSRQAFLEAANPAKRLVVIVAGVFMIAVSVLIVVAIGPLLTNFLNQLSA